MKNTGKRIISALLVAIMFIGIAPMEFLTGLSFGGLFGMKANAVDYEIIYVNDLSNLNYKIYNALRTGKQSTIYVNGVNTYWAFSVYKGKSIDYQVRLKDMSNDSWKDRQTFYNTHNSYGDINNKLTVAANKVEGDPTTNIRYAYKTCTYKYVDNRTAWFLPWYDWDNYINQADIGEYYTLYIAWLDFFVNPDDNDLTLYCHKNGHVELTFYYPDVGALNTSKSKCIRTTQIPVVNDITTTLLPHFTISLTNYGARQYYIDSYYLSGRGKETKLSKEIQKNKKGIEIAWATGQALKTLIIDGKIPIKELIKLGSKIAGTDVFESIVDGSTTSSSYTADKKHPVSKNGKYVFRFSVYPRKELKDCEDFFQTIVILDYINKNSSSVKKTYSIEFDTNEEQTIVVNAKSSWINATAIKNPNSTIYPAETSKLTFSNLSATDNTNATSRNVEVKLDGKINNSGNQKITSYGFLVKKGSSSLAMKDAKWTCNDATTKGTVSLSRTIKDLEPDSLYYYAVFAKTSQGLLCSSIKSFRTKKVRPYETKINFVKTVNYRNGELMNSNELGIGDSVTVEWDGKLPKYAEWYKMEITHPDGTTEIKDQIKGTRATIQLTEEGTYGFRVRACNTAGESDWTTTEDKSIVHPDVSLTFMVGEKEYEKHILTWGHDLESMPAVPSIAGSVFCGWFREGDATLASVKNIREDTVLFAQFKDNYFIVRFQDADGNDIHFQDDSGKDITAQKVPYGGTAQTPQNAPVPDDCKFVGWDHSYSNIVEHLTIKAVVVKKDDALPVAIVNDGSADPATAVRHDYGYEINCTLRNETPQKDVRGRIIVAIKSVEGKLLTITESAAYFIKGNPTVSVNDDKSGYNTDTLKIVVPIDAARDAAGMTGVTAEIYAVESFRNTVPLSNAVIMTITNCANPDHCSWTRWFSEPQEQYQTNEKETVTEYRYQVFEQRQTNFLSEVQALNAIEASEAANSNEDVEGQRWVYYDDESKTTTTTSGWSKVKPEVLEYRTIEEKTVEERTTHYYYKRYKYYNSGWWYSYGSSWATNNGYSGKWEYKDTTSPLPEYKKTSDGHAMRYGNANDFWFKASVNTSQGTTYTKDSASILTGTHKEYRYTDEIHTYVLNRWSEWTDWSAKAPDSVELDISDENDITISSVKAPLTSDEAIIKYVNDPLTKDERKDKKLVMQYRTFYRYKTSDLSSVAEADYEFDPTTEQKYGCAGNICLLIPGTTEEEIHEKYAGKQLTLFVYKYNEVSDWTTEYVAQATIQDDDVGSYTFEQGVLREKPTEETGDFTVILSIQGSTDSIYLGKIEAPVPVYTVIYKDDADFGGTVISEQQVPKGGDAEAPDLTAIEHEGYTFSHWDMRSTNINGDTEINAEFDRNMYTVILNDPLKDDGGITFVRIPHGATLRVDRTTFIEKTEEVDEDIFLCQSAAETPEMRFVKWDLINPSDEDGIVKEEIAVTQDMVLTALYEPRTYEVLFMNIDEQNVEAAPQGARALVRAAEEEDGVGEEARVVKVQEVQYGDTLNSTSDYVDDVDFGDDVILFGWSTEDDDEIIDFDTFTISEDTYLTPQYTFINTVETPTSNVETGSYTSSQVVTLSTETENAVIYYTLDGSDPSISETAIEYTSPIAITTSCVLRTMACKFNCNNSDEAAYVYAINDGSEPAQHVVTYAVYDYELPLKQFLVEEGTMLKPSDFPTVDVDGYTFDGAYRTVQAPEENEEYPTFSNPWDFGADFIFEDVTLYLNYTANTYTVAFLDYDGFVLDEQEIAYGASAEEPNAPEREGYVFVGWDTEAYEYVTGDLELNAVYVPESEYARVTLNKSKYTATQGTSFRLTAEVTGNLENPALIWSSSDENVAIVDDDGTVTTTGKGTADITVQIENSIEYAVCKLTVLPDPNAELMLRSNSYLTMDDYGFIRGFTVYTDEELNHFAPTVAEVRGEFANSDLVFVSADGTMLTDDDHIGTGTVIRLMDGDQELDSVTVIISGDLDGNGYITTHDASLILQAVVQKIVLTDLQIAAADVNGSGSVNNPDASMILRYLVGKETL